MKNLFLKWILRILLILLPIIIIIVAFFNRLEFILNVNYKNRDIVLELLEKDDIIIENIENIEKIEYYRNLYSDYDEIKIFFKNSDIYYYGEVNKSNLNLKNYLIRNSFSVYKIFNISFAVSIIVNCCFILKIDLNGLMKKLNLKLL